MKTTLSQDLNFECLVNNIPPETHNTSHATCSTTFSLHFVQHFIFIFIFIHCHTFPLILTMKVYVQSFFGFECLVNNYSPNTFLFIFGFLLYTSPTHSHYEGLSSFCCHALVHSDQILTGDTLNHTNSLLRNDSSPFRANVHVQFFSVHFFFHCFFFPLISSMKVFIPYLSTLPYLSNKNSLETLKIFSAIFSVTISLHFVHIFIFDFSSDISPSFLYETLSPLF